MKKPILILFALLIALLPLTISHSSEQDLPAVPTVDNETPFVYRTVPESALSYEWYIGYYALNNIASSENTPYQWYAADFGNPPIRHFQSETDETWYTILSTYDNCLLYVFLEPNDRGEFYFRQYGVYELDIRANPHIMGKWVFAYDLPAAILGDALPPYCQPGYASAEQVARSTGIRWSSYNDYCMETCIGLYPDGVLAPPRNAFYRCFHSVCFERLEEHDAAHGLYNYDLLLDEYGTGTLIYRHYLYWGLKPELDWERTYTLNAQEVQYLLQVIKDADFANIPTVHPEELRGFDGETTYFYGSRESHLIAMWGADWERYGIYRIRTAFETVAQAHFSADEPETAALQ